MSAEVNENLKSGEERMTEGPLNKLKTVELCSFVAGPYCTKLFADFDAEVIKIEPPGVDQAKRLKELETENTRLKKLVTDLSLDNSILKEAAWGNW
jgi:crotonobetainyl-CoA:carnitine CoA-transferase CaiB-like acyl-CoA transferase